MNDRLKELAEQAGYLPDSFGVGHWDMPECQKFAELIIEDCISKITNAMGNTDQSDLAYNAMLTSIIAEIRDSFDIRKSKSQKFRREFENAFKHGIDLSNQETP
jgi:hypothetical protein